MNGVCHDWQMKIDIFCDFDDTITRTNVTDAVLEKFADPLWHEIQEDWLAGTLGAREVLEKQMPLVTVCRKDLDDLIDSIEVDPSFADFAAGCAQRNDSLYILSDGFDYWIHRILGRVFSAQEKVAHRIPVFACNLKLNGDRLGISFPYFPQGCNHGCATCKPRLIQRLRAPANKAIVIGDGVSDVLPARCADLVLAKNGLMEWCRKEGIPSFFFNDFHDVSRLIETL
jgi:2,3-diketo-5-methylthio-1-phosphopentane phosphatase